MNQQIFNEMTTLMHERADQIVQAKRPDYTQANTDVLASFKRAAVDAGITPYKRG